MQSSRSDPAIQRCSSGSDSLSVIVNGSAHFQPSESATLPSFVQSSVSQGRGVNTQSKNVEKWSPTKLLSCVVPVRSYKEVVTPQSVVKKLDKRKAKSEERNWIATNFPNQQTSPKHCSCFLPQDEDYVPPVKNGIVGRKVAPGIFILSFVKAQGGISYTLGNWSGGRGFFLHPARRRRRPLTLEVIESRLDAAGERRQRFLDERVEVARMLTIRKRGRLSETTTDSEETTQSETIPETAERSSRTDDSEAQSEPCFEKKKHYPQGKKPKRTRSEKTVWCRLSTFFGASKTDNETSELGTLKKAITLLKADDNLETISLPDRAFSEPLRSRQLRKRRPKAMEMRAPPPSRVILEEK